MRAVLAILSFGLALSWMATVLAASPEIDYGRINVDVSAKHIRAGYQAFQTEAGGLQSAANDLCRAPNEKTLAAIRTAYHAAADAWQAVEHLRFGPAQAISAHARLNFWPDKRGRVGKHLRKLMARKDLEAALQADAFAKGSVAVQGFPALERLLFGDDVLGNLKTPSGGVSPCTVITAISVNIESIGKALVAAWHKDIIADKPAKDGAGALLSSLAGGLQAVVDLKLGGPLGSKSGRVRAKRAEHWRSKRALRNVELNLMALRDLYRRLSDGIGKRLAGSPEDRLIRQLFDQAITDTQALGRSFMAAAASEQGVLQLKSLSGGIQDLRELAVPNLAEGLDLVLGFNSFDGD